MNVGLNCLSIVTIEIFCYLGAVAFTNSTSGPMWDNPELCHLYWLLNRLTAAMANENEVINLVDCPTWDHPKSQFKGPQWHGICTYAGRDAE